MSESTLGAKVHKPAMPMTALITSRANSCGTTVNTKIVDTSATITMIMGVLFLNGWFPISARDTVMRSAALCRKSASCSRSGACSAIQSLYAVISDLAAGSRFLVRLLYDESAESVESRGQLGLEI